MLYVWFEAPIGYISATKEWAIAHGDKKAWEKYWLDQETKLVQFVGKDNIPFHAVIFPAMTMGQNTPYKLVDELVANEFYNLQGRQFSKSDGWYVDLKQALERYSADQIRYAICSNAPESQDSEFTWKDFQMRVNSDLAGKFGNFVHRVLTFVRKELPGSLPKQGTLSSEDQEFLQNIDSKFEEIKTSFSSFRVRRGCQLIMELAQLGNGYFDLKKPWKAAKSEETRESMETTLYACLECIRRLALCSSCVVPQAANLIWSFLGMPGSIEECTFEKGLQLPMGVLQEPKVLFRRIEDTEVSQEIQLLESSI